MNVSIKCPICDVVGSWSVGDCGYGDHMREFECSCGTKLVIDLDGWCKGFPLPPLCVLIVTTTYSDTDHLDRT